MDKHDFLPQLLLVGIHHFAEFVKLHIQHIGVRQTAQIVEKFGNVQVLHDDVVFFLVVMLHASGLWTVGVAFFLHGTLQRAAVDNHLLGRQIVASDVD